MRAQFVQTWDDAEQSSYSPPALECHVKMEDDEIQEIRMQNNDRPDCEWVESGVVCNLELQR